MEFNIVAGNPHPTNPSDAAGRAGGFTYCCADFSAHTFQGPSSICTLTCTDHSCSYASADRSYSTTDVEANVNPSFWSVGALCLTVRAQPSVADFVTDSDSPISGLEADPPPRHADSPLANPAKICEPR